MTAFPLAARAASPAGPLRPLHLWLSLQTLAVVLVSLNRLGPWTTGYAAGNEFLRWVDLHNMLTLPLLSLTAYFGVQRMLEGNPATAAPAVRTLLAFTFTVGVYLLGAGYGAHEVTNYLHVRYCAGDTASDLCRILIFNDDEFSHWLFFGGFVLVNGALLGLQAARPFAHRAGRGDMALLALNALAIAAGIFANLAFEPIGLDLYVVALLAAAALALLRRVGRQPLLVYYAAAYTLGLVATAAVKLAL